jgi:hypothetical protein
MRKSPVLLLLAFAAISCTTAPADRTGEAAAPAQGIPRTADGKPDFTGVYAGPGFSHIVGPDDTDTPRVTLFDRKTMPPFVAGGQAFMSRKLTGNLLLDDPTERCLPNGLTRQILSPYAQQWVQHPQYLVNLTEYMHFFRVIPLDGRPHPQDVEPTWMGNSVGRWEGDTLVIDTIGLKEWHIDATQNAPNQASESERGTQSWHSDQLRVTERLTYTDPTTIAYQVTLEDPKIWTAPWASDFIMKRHPTWYILEFVCEENNRCLNGRCAPNE